MTMRAIGRCVGIRASAIYRHYPSKAALIDAVAMDDIARLEQKAQRENAKFVPVRSLVKVFTMLVKYTRGEPHMFALLRDRKLPDGKTPAVIFERSCKRAQPKLSFEYIDELCRTLWAAVAGPATGPAYGNVHDPRFQLMRSLGIIRTTLSAMDWRVPRPGKEPEDSLFPFPLRWVQRPVLVGAPP